MIKDKDKSDNDDEKMMTDNNKQNEASSSNSWEEAQKFLKTTPWDLLIDKNKTKLSEKWANFEVFEFFLPTQTSKLKLDFTALLATQIPLDRHPISPYFKHFDF